MELKKVVAWKCAKCGISTITSQYYDDKSNIISREFPIVLEGDHIMPLSQGGEFWDIDNVQPLCKLCHKEKTHSDWIKTKDMIEKGELKLTIIDNTKRLKEIF